MTYCQIKLKKRMIFIKFKMKNQKIKDITTAMKNLKN